MRKGRPRNNPREREICVPLCLIHFLNNVKNTIHVVSEEIQHALCQRDYVKKRATMMMPKRVYVADVKSNVFEEYLCYW